MTTELRSSFLDALGESKTDCVSMWFETENREFTLEFADLRQGRFLNLCALDPKPDDLTDRSMDLVERSELVIDYDSEMSVTFETRSDDVDDLLAETASVLALLEASVDDLETVEHRNLQPEGIVSKTVRRAVEPVARRMRA